MKRLVYLFVLVFLLLSCSTQKEGEKKELNIYTWESFIPEEVISNFEKETGIKVNVAYYDTNDAMIAKLLSGVKDYDIISPSTDFISALKENNFLEKLDKSKLDGIFKNIIIDNTITDTYDKNLEYSIPYNLFATGITVNKEILGNEEDVKNRSVNILSNEKYKGKVTILDDSREVLGLALQSLGYESNSSNDKQLQEAKDLVLKWKNNIAKFENSVYGKGLASGEFVAAHGYPDVFYEIEDDEFDKFIYYLPKGAMMYIDSMAILKDAPNKENAYKFLNFLYRPENYVKVLDKFRTPSVLKNVKANKKPVLEIDYVLKNSTLPKALDNETKEKQDKIFNEIKVK